LAKGVLEEVKKNDKELQEKVSAIKKLKEQLPK
jgi:hypothetical protein